MNVKLVIRPKKKKERQIFEESCAKVGGRHFGEITKTTLSKIDLPYSKH